MAHKIIISPDESFEIASEPDRMLPIANVGRIMRQALPPSAKISNAAKKMMQECATEFLSFMTGEASNHCLLEKRKTMNGNDICCALTSLGFDDYCSALNVYLKRYRAGERTAQARARHNNKNASNNNNHNKNFMGNKEIIVEGYDDDDDEIDAASSDYFDYSVGY